VQHQPQERTRPAPWTSEEIRLWAPVGTSLSRFRLHEEQPVHIGRATNVALDDAPELSGWQHPGNFPAPSSVRARRPRPGRSRGRASADPGRPSPRPRQFPHKQHYVNLRLQGCSPFLASPSSPTSPPSRIHTHPRIRVPAFLCGGMRTVQRGSRQRASRAGEAPSSYLFGPLLTSRSRPLPSGGSKMTSGPRIRIVHFPRSTSRW
jgi:hypothetical protein